MWYTNINKLARASSQERSNSIPRVCMSLDNLLAIFSPVISIIQYGLVFALKLHHHCCFPMERLPSPFLIFLQRSLPLPAVEN